MQKNNYMDIMEKNHLEIGDAIKVDCKVEEVDSNPLARLHGKRQQCSDQ